MKLAKGSSLLLFFGIALFISTFCKSNVIDGDKLVRIYVENIILEETHQSNPDSLNLEKAKLFKKYNTTKEAFELELSSMGSDKEKWEKFFNKARILLEDLRKSGAIN